MPQPRVESVGYTALIPKGKDGGFFRFGYSESEVKMSRYAMRAFGMELAEKIHIVAAVRLETGRIFVVDNTALRLLRGGK